MSEGACSRLRKANMKQPMRWLNGCATNWFIVLPQALAVSIPQLVGQVISSFKETSLLAIIGLFDFLRVANSVIPAEGGSWV